MMKGFLVILSIVQLIIITNAVPDRCGSGVKYVYPGDNTKFIICENHIPIAKKCPNNWIFNENVQVCESSGVVGNSRIINVDINSGSSGNVRVYPATNTYGNSRYPETNSNGYDRNNQPTYSNQGSTSSGIKGRPVGSGSNIENRGTVRHENNPYDVPSYNGVMSGQDSSNVGPGRDQGFGYNGQHFTGTDQSGYNTASSTRTSTVQTGVTGQLGHTVTATSPGYSGVIYNGERRDQSGYNTGTSSQHGYGVVPTFKPNQSGLVTGNLQGTGYQGGSQHTNTGSYGIKTHQHGSGYDAHKHENYDTTHDGIGYKGHYHHGHNDNINLNVIGGSTGHSSESCRGVDFGEHISYPGDCTKFIVCMETGVVVKNCPPATHFNAKLQICDWPNSAQCHYHH